MGYFLYLQVVFLCNLHILQETFDQIGQRCFANQTFDPELGDSTCNAVAFEMLVQWTHNNIYLPEFGIQLVGFPVKVRRVQTIRKESIS